MLFLGTDRILPHLLDEHLETLGWLWTAHAAAARAPDEFPKRLRGLGERLAAHADALVLAGSDALALLTAALEGDDPGGVTAAAHVLLWMRRPGPAASVLDALAGAEPPRLRALATACHHAPLAGIADGLAELWRNAPDAVAVEVAHVLAFQQQPPADAGRLAALLGHALAPVRARAWETVALIDRAGGPRGAPPRPFAQGWSDADEAVRSAALEAAAWAGDAAVLDHCRASSGEAERSLLAALGTPEDAAGVLAAALADPAAGPGRFAIIARAGHPQLLPTLIDAIGIADPAVAAAAALAFNRVTACDVGSGRRVLPAGGDEFEREFAEPIELPDPELAAAHWRDHQARYQGGTRWRRGLDLGAGLPDDAVLRRLDNQARWDARLRARLAGTWDGGPSDLLALPPPAERA